MIERLQKILASRGVASRRQAEELIKAGRVSCNGIVCKLGDSANPDTDTILLDGKPIPSAGKQVYILLNKPRGYVTTLSDELGRKNAAQLVADCGQRVYPVGRLDMDSEGLLLYTNEGDFANYMMHPKHEVKKTYLVTVNDFTQQGLARLQRPMILDGYRLQIPQVEVLEPHNAGGTQLRITIHEGRNRQVRRMCAIAGMKVRRLVRIAEGSLELGNLPCGKWRYLSEQEVTALKK